MQNVYQHKFLESITQLIDRSSFETTIAYKFAILTIFGFIVSIFFNPIIGIPSQDSVFYIHAFSSTLCLLFILGDLWIPNNSNKILSYFWFLILIFCLPFMYSYIFVRSEYYYSWLFNFVLSTILLYLLIKKEMFLFTWGIGSLLGFICASILNFYIRSNPIPPYLPFDYNYAVYSSIFLSLVITLIVYNKFYTQKQLLLIVEQEVVDRTKELQQSLDTKRDFLNNVSHEIKTPVHNITNIVNILNDKWDVFNNKKKKELITTLMSCNQRLLNLCSNLLDLSKLKKGESKLVVVECNIEQLLQEIVQEYNHTQKYISMDVSAELRKIIYCNSDQILQVLRNLIDNTIRYGNNSPILISLQNYGNNIKFSVSDNGLGIPEKELENIFEPFEQSTRTKTKAGGTGLGLSICKQIIKLHMGSIWAKNNISGGVTFYFTIPNRINQ